MKPGDLKKTLTKRINATTIGDVFNRQTGLENLKRHSFENVITGNDSKKDNATVKSGSVEDIRLNSGKPTLIPFLYEGRIVSAAEATDRAVASKRVWPAFTTNTAATKASKKISSRLGRSK